MNRFIFVTGGVMSSLGKGITAASLGVLLQKRGFSVKIRKLDPYINVDPGTMSPYQHGEVFVTDDGAETDMDLGHYERFTGVRSSHRDSISTGRIYANIIEKERRGEYLGSTVQVIPHVTDEIKDFIMSGHGDADFMICEIGGTVGDIEILPFIEAIRQFGNQVGRKHSLFLHLTWLPFFAATKEIKTKPAQHSVKTLLGLGIQPDILLCRCERPVDEDTRRKLALFCNMEKERVIPAPDVESIYQVPLTFHEHGVDAEVCKYFGIVDEKPLDLEDWRQFNKNILHPEQSVTIGVIGKYVGLAEAYKSLSEALAHGGAAHRTKVHIKWIDSEDLETRDLGDALQRLDAILVPGGFGKRGIEGKIKAIEYARTRKIPFLGICLGMQLSVIETARHLAGLKNANSTEWDQTTDTPVVGLLTEWDREGKTNHMEGNMGGTMRLGSYPCVLENGSLAHSTYGAKEVRERHRHRYEVNMHYRDVLTEAGLVFSGLSPDGKLPEVVERKDHLWFVAVQFHPEFLSHPFKPHPLFSSFVGAALKQSRLI
jgi:CTP synthase